MVRFLSDLKLLFFFIADNVKKDGTFFSKWATGRVEEAARNISGYFVQIPEEILVSFAISTHETDTHE